MSLSNVKGIDPSGLEAANDSLIKEKIKTPFITLQPIEDMKDGKLLTEGSRPGSPVNESIITLESDLNAIDLKKKRKSSVHKAGLHDVTRSQLCFDPAGILTEAQTRSRYPKISNLSTNAKLPLPPISSANSRNAYITRLYDDLVKASTKISELFCKSQSKEQQLNDLKSSLGSLLTLAGFDKSPVVGVDLSRCERRASLEIEVAQALKKSENIDVYHKVLNHMLQARRDTHLRFRIKLAERERKLDLAKLENQRLGNVLKKILELNRVTQMEKKKLMQEITNDRLSRKKLLKLKTGQSNFNAATDKKDKEATNLNIVNKDSHDSLSDSSYPAIERIFENIGSGGAEEFISLFEEQNACQRILMEKIQQSEQTLAQLQGDLLKYSSFINENKSVLTPAETTSNSKSLEVEALSSPVQAQNNDEGNDQNVIEGTQEQGHERGNLDTLTQGDGQNNSHSECHEKDKTNENEQSEVEQGIDEEQKSDNELKKVEQDDEVDMSTKNQLKQEQIHEKDSRHVAEQKHPEQNHEEGNHQIIMETCREIRALWGKLYRVNIPQLSNGEMLRNLYQERLFSLGTYQHDYACLKLIEALLTTADSCCQSINGTHEDSDKNS